MDGFPVDVGAAHPRRPLTPAKAVPPDWHHHNRDKGSGDFGADDEGAELQHNMLQHTNWLENYGRFEIDMSTHLDALIPATASVP